MTPVIGLLIILVIAFAGTRFFRHSAILKHPLIAGFVASGIPYILVGVFLGPRFFNFLSDAILENLQPFISLALGWIGLLFGIQLRWKNIRRYPRNYLLFLSTQFLISFLIIILFLFLFLFLIYPRPYASSLHLVLILGALGALTAPLTINRIVVDKKARGKLTHLLLFTASLDNFWGIALAGILMLLFHPFGSPDLPSFLIWISLTLATGIGIAFIFRFLIQLHFDHHELLLLVLGLVIFTSGIGFYFHISPIFLNMIVGIVLAQFHRESEKVMRVLGLAEKPIYLFLLVFAGAMWKFHLVHEIAMVGIFILARFVAKYLAGGITSKFVDCAFPIPFDVGKGLFSFGGVALAIAFNFDLFYGGLMGSAVMSATIFAIFAFDEYAAIAAQKILKREGEIK